MEFLQQKKCFLDFDPILKNRVSHVWISTSKYWVKLMTQMTLPVTVVPKQVSTFTTMINVLRGF